MTNHVLGILRLDLGRPPVNEGGLQLLWVLDFPLFEALDGDGRPIPAHHPFTMPHPEDLDLLDSSSGEDLLDGALAGLRPRAQRLGARLGQRPDPLARSCSRRSSRSSASTPEEAQARFGFLLDAFRFGAPPHAGLRVRHRPPGRAARGRGEHPRGHRVPEDPEGPGPAHRRAERRSTRCSSRELGLTVPKPKGKPAAELSA